MENSDSNIKVEENKEKQNNERAKLIRNWLIFGAILLSMYGCSKSAEVRANNLEAIKKVSAEYPDGATLIDATKEEGAVFDIGKMWLDLDGDTNTTEVLIAGYTDRAMEKRLWQENKIGDKRLVADWAARVEKPKIRVVPGKTRE